MKIQYKILVVLILVGVIWISGCTPKEIPPEKYCEKDEDCVINDCCRCSDELINKNFINCTDYPVCPMMTCDTLTGRSIASPKCIKNECKLIIKKPLGYIFYKITKK